MPEPQRTEESPTRPPTPTWKTVMSWVQGLSYPLLFLTFWLSITMNRRWAAIFTVVTTSGVFLNAMVTYLWRLRHVLHFWWVLLLACLVHAATLPGYILLTRALGLVVSGSGSFEEGVMLVVLAAEIFGLLALIKWVAMRLHERRHPAWPQTPR